VAVLVVLYRYCFNRIAHVVHVDTKAELWLALVSIVASLLRRGITTLVFLPGKAEIQQVREALKKEGIGDAILDDLHAELEDSVIERVKQPSKSVRGTIYLFQALRLLGVCLVPFV
jgi:HrpA-like RNA helicase